MIAGRRFGSTSIVALAQKEVILHPSEVRQGHLADVFLPFAYEKKFFTRLSCYPVLLARLPSGCCPWRRRPTIGATGRPCRLAGASMRVLR